MSTWKSALTRLPRPQLLARTAQLIDVSALVRLLGFTDVRGHTGHAPLRPTTRLLLIGLVVWVVLVGLATVVAITSVEMSTVNFSDWFGARSSADADPRAAAGLRYDNVVQRPLFSRSRQASAVPPPPAPLSTPREKAIILKGVYINGASAKAFLISQHNPLGIWVQTDEVIAGWRIVTIKPDQVLLDAQSETLVVPLGARGDAK
jgi:hypothetical protein